MGTRYKRVNKVMEYYYNINQFEWSQAENTFYAFAPNLVTILPDHTIHPYAFANMKEQFYILNPETGGRQRFRFVKEDTKTLSIDEYDMEWEECTFTYWLFESEDEIKCKECTYTYWLFESEDGIKCKVWIT